MTAPELAESLGALATLAIPWLAWELRAIRASAERHVRPVVELGGQILAELRRIGAA